MTEKANDNKRYSYSKQLQTYRKRAAGKEKRAVERRWTRIDFRKVRTSRATSATKCMSDFITGARRWEVQRFSALPSPVPSRLAETGTAGTPASAEIAWG